MKDEEKKREKDKVDEIFLNSVKERIRKNELDK